MPTLCDRHGLHFDPALHAGCVLCRRESVPSPPPPSRAKPLLLTASALAALALLSAAGITYKRYYPIVRPSAAAATAANGALAPVTTPLEAINSEGRHGAFYVPVHAPNEPLPLLVAFHGTGGNGAGMVDILRPFADAHRFMVVAADSRRSPSGDYTWEVGNRAGDVTPDLTHTMACVHEALARSGASLDMDHVLALGFSGGGSSAPYIATNEAIFTAFADLHGGVFAGGLGSRRVRGWLSTGVADNVRPYGPIARASDELRHLGFADITLRDFPGGHMLSGEELRAVLAWWIGDRR